MGKLLNTGLVYPEHAEQLISLDHPAIVEWIYAREMFRRLGFPAEDLFFGIHKTADYPGAAITIVLRVQDKEFEWLIGVVEGDVEKTAAFYDELVASQEILKARWDKNPDAFFQSWAFDKRWVLMNALIADGFHFSSTFS